MSDTSSIITQLLSLDEAGIDLAKRRFPTSSFSFSALKTAAVHLGIRKTLNKSQLIDEILLQQNPSTSTTFTTSRTVLTATNGNVKAAIEELCSMNEMQLNVVKGNHTTKSPGVTIHRNDVKKMATYLNIRGRGNMNKSEMMDAIIEKTKSLDQIHVPAANAVPAANPPPDDATTVIAQLYALDEAGIDLAKRRFPTSSFSFSALKTAAVHLGIRKTLNKSQLIDEILLQQNPSTSTTFTTSRTVLTATNGNVKAAIEELCSMNEMQLNVAKGNHTTKSPGVTLRLKDVKEMATYLNIRGRGNLKKAQLIDAIIETYKVVEPIITSTVVVTPMTSTSSLAQILSPASPASTSSSSSSIASTSSSSIASTSSSTASTSTASTSSTSSSSSSIASASASASALSNKRKKPSTKEEEDEVEVEDEDENTMNIKERAISAKYYWEQLDALEDRIEQLEGRADYNPDYPCSRLIDARNLKERFRKKLRL